MQLKFEKFTSFVGEIRVAIDDNLEVWFVAKDVCDCLGIKNSRDALTRLDDDEKNSVGLTDGIPMRGNPNISIISESGFYTLVLSSRKSEAKDFRRWVTKEVLPSIRKNGAYAVDEKWLGLWDDCEDLSVSNDDPVELPKKALDLEESWYRTFASYNAMIDEQARAILKRRAEKYNI